ncbi:MAG TPA: hypothetical protein VG204_04385 [Terriglobia bacterium]|nr:hypothetical protein [Terriglobia bacterium]
MRTPWAVDPNWHNRFVMVTRGFLEEFSLKMSRNAWVLYLALGTFYHLYQQRSFPKLEMLEAVCPLSKFSRSRALRELVDLGLVEVWGEQRGRKRRTFYRLLHVDAKGHHVAKVEQPTYEDIYERLAQGALSPGYEWVQRAYLKTVQEVCPWHGGFRR